MEEKGDFPIVCLNGESYFLIDGAAPVSVTAAKEACLKMNVRGVRELIALTTAPRKGSKPRNYKKKRK